MPARTRCTNACAAHGGFEHNLQSLRVVDRLEVRYPGFDGLNLSFETREGILKHCSRRNADRLVRAEPDGLARRFLDGSQPSLEAQLVNLADEMAYNAHDIDDGVRSGLLTPGAAGRGAAASRTGATQVLADYPALAAQPGRRLLFESAAAHAVGAGRRPGRAQRRRAGDAAAWQTTMPLRSPPLLVASSPAQRELADG